MSGVREERRDEAVASYLLALDAGQRPDPEEWVGRYPDVAEELRAFLADQQRLARLAEPLRSLGPRAMETIALTGATPAPGAAPATAPARLADYDVLSELGRGGMGVVYKARDARLNRVVALKMILLGNLADEDQIRRFRQEAEDAGRLDHPNIVPIYQVGEEQGHPYFTMKLIEGGGLCALAARFHADPRAAAQFMATISRAVHYAHQHGIIHRDLKPGNILVDGDGQPHVTDFGLAKHLAARDANTQTGAVVGTPSYMAPEQASGRTDLTVAADVYSLGVVLYELLTGRPPFRDPNPFDTLRQVIEAEPTPPRALNPRVDRDLETVCLKCLRKEPAGRYASAEALADDLTRYSTGEPIQARRVGRLERVTKWVRRRPAAAALVAVSALAVVALPLLAVGGWYSLHLQEANRSLEDANRNLQDALHVAEQERQKADHERAKVADGFGKRLEAIDDMLLNVDGRLANVQGAEPVRLEFLLEAQRLSNELLRDEPSNPQALRQAGRVNRSLAELALRRGTWRESEEVLRQARAIQEKLAANFPDDLKYQRDLTLTCARQGDLYAGARRHDDALLAYDRAINLQDELLRRYPGAEEYLTRCGNYRFQKANILEEIGRLDEALPLYRRAIEYQEELVRLFPKQATHREELAATATSLGYALDQADPAEAASWLERSVAASRDVYSLARSQRSYRALRLAYGDLAEFHRLRQHYTELARLGGTLPKDFPRNANETYNAACYTADAVKVAGAIAGLNPTERQQLTEGYGAQAVALLRQAVQEGFSDREHAAKDADLDPLRGRPDFQQFLADLEQRFPTRPATPAGILASLQQEYAAGRNDYLALQKDAHTVAEKKRADAHKPSFDAVARRVLDVAEKNAQLPASLDALVWVLENGEPTHDRLAAQAVQLLERDHLKKKDLGPACAALARHPSPAGDRFLRAAEAGGSGAVVRGLAAFGLAVSLKTQAEAAFRRGAGDAADLSRQAEEQLEKVVSAYGDVVLEIKAPPDPAGEQLAVAARQRLAELRLGPGRVARAIEGSDLGGKPMKLSDYKGKVVLVSFWANWCGYCRQMYPAEKALVEQMKDRPFALLGVNADDDGETGRAAVVRNKLNWRSWADEGGKLRAEWQVSSFPTLYLLDSAGVIRNKWQGAPAPGEVESAVEALVVQVERAARP
jgi:thiol-disulfide isomerase/thioredoxin